MDVTTKAVALRAADYKENDKMVLLYSLEYGKISVQAKGVKKNAAKLKFACDQFCFGNYELAQNGERFTLRTCDQLESFYVLREDVVTYYAACAAAECLINYTEEGQSDAGIFVVFLKTLQQLSLGTDPLLVTLKFFLDFWNLDGFGLNFSRCSVCGKKSLKFFLDFERGGIVCDDCVGINGVAVSPAVVSECKMLDGLPYEKLKNIATPQCVTKDALSIFGKYISHSFFPPRTLSELLKLA